MLFEKIMSCNEWALKTHPCKNANGQPPLAMPIPSECRIMLITQAPSKLASEQRILANSRNKTFNQVLEVMSITKDVFQRFVYWTHYGKCYPGGRDGGDQWPTVHCANNFLEKEINLCKEKGCLLIIGVAEPCSKYLYSRFINKDCKISSLKFHDIRNIKYKTDDLNWALIKHTAVTAIWSRNQDDAKFIKGILQPEVQKAIK